MPRISPEQLGEYRARVEENEADVDAWHWIGYFHYWKEGGVEEDEEEAQRIWRRVLSDFGNDEDLHDGTGKTRYELDHDDEAVPRLQWEAAQGDSMSQWYLVMCFRGGLAGLEVDDTQVAYWSQRSAEQGNVEAQEQIAECYEYGKGVERDLVKAVEWYDKAIAQGSDNARRCRQYLIDSLGTRKTERDQVLGCVQRNIWLENVQQSVQSGAPPPPPLGVWALALEKLAGTRHQQSVKSGAAPPPLDVWTLAMKKLARTRQNEWASPSPTFLFLSWSGTKVVRNVGIAIASTLWYN